MSAEQPTFNQINDQLATQEHAATVLAVRNSGEISTGQVVAMGEHGTRVFFTDLNQESHGGVLPSKPVSAEQLSDQHQEKLAAELAGTALRGSEPTLVKNGLPPLTETDIARITRMRGGARPSVDDIKGINAARAQGNHIH